jgi:hypothetical protein
VAPLSVRDPGVDVFGRHDACGSESKSPAARSEKPRREDALRKYVETTAYRDELQAERIASLACSEVERRTYRGEHVFYCSIEYDTESGAVRDVWVALMDDGKLYTSDDTEALQFTLPFGGEAMEPTRREQRTHVARTGP